MRERPRAIRLKLRSPDEDPTTSFLFDPDLAKPVHPHPKTGVLGGDDCL